MRTFLLLSSFALLSSAPVLGQIRVDDRNLPQLDRFLRADQPLPRVPPPVLSLELKLLERPSREGNAVLQLECGRPASSRLRGRLPVLWDGRLVELDDRGGPHDPTAADGRLCGPVEVDLGELQKLHERLRSVQIDERRDPFRFVGRQRVPLPTRRLEPLPPLDLRPGGTIDLSFLRDRLHLLSPSITVDPRRSLMITDLSVVEDPARTFNPCTGVGTALGPWTFGHLMTQMANESATGISPSTFVRRWLSRWEHDQVVNDQTVPARAAIQSQIIAPWEAASGGPGAPLDLARAPFRLLAIVNRIDLRENFAYGGGGGSAGEARFVFCPIDLATCAPLPFTVIFEYGIRKKDCAELHAWGESWAKLSTMALPSAAYNDALQAITDTFVSAGANPDQVPNRSALSQLRTNEIAIGSPWELREFRLDGTSAIGHLAEVTVKQTPAETLNGSTVLATWVNTHPTDVLPVSFPGVEPFLASRALINPTRFFWDAAGIADRDARHNFSLGTCNGCHGGETFPPTAPFFFTHVRQRAAGVPASLSGFLTGVTVPDPADGFPSRTFGDLERRRVDLETLLASSCRLFPLTELVFVPLHMEH